MQDKHYLVYLITNTVNGKIYVGKHETLDPDDDYMGSGHALKRAQRKYGIDKFTKTILADFDEPWSMANMEATIVDEEFVKRKDTYNITLGGIGGFYHVNSVRANWTDEQRNEFGERMSKKMTPINQSIEKRKAASVSLKTWNLVHGSCWKGKHHTPEALQKQHETFLRTHHAQGEKNSQYGKHWWHDPITGESHPFHDDEVPQGWVRGRLIKWGQ